MEGFVFNRLQGRCCARPMLGAGRGGIVADIDRLVIATGSVCAGRSSARSRRSTSIAAAASPPMQRAWARPMTGWVPNAAGSMTHGPTSSWRGYRARRADIDLAEWGDSGRLARSRIDGTAAARVGRVPEMRACAPAAERADRLLSLRRPGHRGRSGETHCGGTDRHWDTPLRTGAERQSRVACFCGMGVCQDCLVEIDGRPTSAPA